ncbi:MAG: sulfurtransferase TusA family protein [Candidatus Methanoperedens sp.]|nr:sulfurtransferase TusA family protein [Candidatus Methanoperedens sp.]MCZ7361616.1 sulfurtransferase TusA family protein [Candidatus Methanoperedens sp.]HLB70351.1 sulfurtransferase TusA family protein [Candidatus Methanoperedens sp.]
MTDIIPDESLDVRGECCPYPLILTKKKVESLKSGEILKVTADDPVAPQNIDSWAKKSGNRLLAVERDGNIFNIYVQRS